ncbi:MAG: anaerobic ribonucleoside-triphosphate reductase activating protein [Alphaproteobacteria bacterium]
MNQLINVGGVETFSTVDYPSKISAVIFMQGCPWKCPFCYNFLLQPIEETDFVWDKFVDFLKTRTKSLDGVVFSGGEPLVQNGLKEAMMQVKALGYKIGLHTGGYRPEALKKVLDVVDWVGFDIKTPFEKEKYNSVTCANHFDKVLESLKMLIASDVDFECRTTCDPRVLNVDDIYKIADTLKEMGVKNYHLQKYRPIDSDKTTQEYECEEFFKDAKLKEHLQNNFNCQFRM